MVRKYLLGFMIAIICLNEQNLIAQELPLNATVNDIANLKEDILNRMKNISKNESEILAEREWVSKAKTSILERQNLYSSSKSSADIDKFQHDLNRLVDNLATLDCSKLEECKSQIENVVGEFNILEQQREIADSFSQPTEWLVIFHRFKKLYIYIQTSSRTSPVTFDKKECEKVKQLFSRSDVKSDITKFTETRKTTFENLVAENNDMLAVLKLAEQEAINYNQKLNEALEKANTKMSLQTNLYLMILTIGLLSIATIGIVRWFPENVMKEWVESGQVIQFVTVMILLSVIMSLGLAGLLGENTLGTLLGGIGGYVLSQGVGRSAARAALKDFKSNTKNIDDIEKR